MIFNSEISDSLTLKFAEAVNERKKRGEDILSLGLGEPDFNPPIELTNALIKALSLSESHRYSPSTGLLSLRKNIAQELKSVNGIPCDSNNIIITPGTKQAMSIILMSLLEPGDEVIIVLPAYVSYVPQVYFAEPQARIKYVHLNKENYGLDLDQVKEAFSHKTKAIIINSPHNPTGNILKKEEIQTIYELSSYYNSYILSDEIYDKLVYSDYKHFSIGALESNVSKVFTINGFGKSYGVTGWRIGYACVPNHSLNKINMLLQHINTNTSTIIQKAFDLAWPLPTQHIVDFNSKLAERLKLYKQFLSENPIIQGSTPKGGFFAFLNIGNLNCDSIKFASQLVDKTGVASTPGIAFSKEWDDHIRISLAIDSNILENAFMRISQFLSQELWK